MGMALIIETVRTCPDLLVREGGVLAGASAKEDDGVMADLSGWQQQGVFWHRRLLERLWLGLR